jgi:hypothetical protein
MASAARSTFANARTSQAGFVGGDLRPAAALRQLDTRGIADVVEIAALTVAADGNRRTTAASAVLSRRFVRGQSADGKERPALHDR